MVSAIRDFDGAEMYVGSNMSSANRKPLRKPGVQDAEAPRESVVRTQPDNQYERVLAEVAIAEQARIGRDLHDTVGQDLAALALSAERASRKMECQPGALALAELAKGIRSALAGLRAAARGLSRVANDVESLVDTLEALAASVQAYRGIECRFRVQPPESALPDEVAEHLYRIASEAVANAVHHASPSRIDIWLGPDSGGLTLRITDDGIGMPAPPVKGGIGTWIMRSRAAAIGAELEIGAHESGGTVVTCRLRGT